MLQLFSQGGILFMSILTLCLLVVLVLTVYYGTMVFKPDTVSASLLRHRLKYIRSVGILSLVIGILGQLIGLYSAFVAIQKAGHVSLEVMAGGLKISMITPLYGILIFIFSYVIWLFLDGMLKE